jgi:hypothetical protein
MKKIILIFLVTISINAKAQNLDTVLVRNLSLQAQDWAWLVGKYVDRDADSATSSQFRRIRDRIRTANPATWSTSVNIDSIPGAIVLAMYKAVKFANAGEIVSRYSAIITAISAKTNLSSWLTTFDTLIGNEFTRFRDRGKNIIMDN